MNRQLKHGTLALGLMLGGIAVGQAISVKPVTDLIGKSKMDYAKQADALIMDYRLGVIGADSAPQVSQVANEATTQLLYITAKQNAEIIRLLTEIKNKK